MIIAYREEVVGVFVRFSCAAFTSLPEDLEERQCPHMLCSVVDGIHQGS
jgi:hypothetical protein